MSTPKDLTGQVFGRLTVIGRAGTSKNGSRLWRCVCECGKEKIASSSHLTCGFIQSCGCLKRETGRVICIARTKHGARSRTNQTDHRLYGVWCGMKYRCNNPSAKPYKNYGGRGIKVCPDWNESFEAFRNWAIASGYNPEAPYGELTLDRIDCNKGYFPDNCRWVDMKVQAHNRRSGRGRNGQYTAANQAGEGGDVQWQHR